MMTKVRTRVRQWTIYAWGDGRFDHARHDDPDRRLVFTESEFAHVDRTAHAAWKYP